MKKEQKFPKQRIINYTELLHKLKFFNDTDKNEILGKLTNKKHK